VFRQIPLSLQPAGTAGAASNSERSNMDPWSPLTSFLRVEIRGLDSLTLYLIDLPDLPDLQSSSQRSGMLLDRSLSGTIHPMKARLIKKFEDELMVLEKELKTELPQEIKRARELGDLRENAEYHAAKERQRLVEARISLLKKRVSDIHLMNIDKIPRDRVGFGSTVHLKDGATAAVTVYQLVMPEDADVERGLISTASPIGRALLNKEEGDEVTVTTPNGSRRFELVKLLTIHDDES
jgi:transcription elongation factor GreA